MYAVAAATASGAGGPALRKRSVIRTEPMSSETACCISPAAVPTISSVEPPPMSITSTGSASAAPRSGRR